jgi:hypothetical protein
MTPFENVAFGFLSNVIAFDRDRQIKMHDVAVWLQDVRTKHFEIGDPFHLYLSNSFPIFTKHSCDRM